MFIAPLAAAAGTVEKIHPGFIILYICLGLTVWFLQANGCGRLTQEVGWTYAVGFLLGAGLTILGAVVCTIIYFGRGFGVTLADPDRKKQRRGPTYSPVDFEDPQLAGEPVHPSIQGTGPAAQASDVHAGRPACPSCGTGILGEETVCSFCGARLWGR
ncbi:MAG: hypothetical protein KKF41_02890 [Actinobacteria bacterium]|nr:hypothetical protein [Actinomycetota bacterium]MBU1945315.1 hypothetical protein [Actinomycetota bacterium]MBU2686515.1 hypothetical protein [Actinomycetota bacterium]